MIFIPGSLFERRMADHEGRNRRPPPQPPNMEDDKADVPRRNRNGSLQHGAGRLSLFSVARPEIRDQRQVSSARDGGTRANSQVTLTGDVIYFTDPTTGNATKPWDTLIEKPDPQPNSQQLLHVCQSQHINPFGNHLLRWWRCREHEHRQPRQLLRSEPAGMPAILGISPRLPYRPKSNCEADHYYRRQRVPFLRY